MKWWLGSTIGFLVIAVSVFTSPAHSADYGITELQYNFGNLDTPTLAGGGDSYTHILTLQHASGWKYGDNFFFVDFLDSGNQNFNDLAVYAEFYANLSFNKIRGSKNWDGPLSDVGLIGGFNWSSEAKARKYLPGVRFAWSIPRFAFANLDVTAYIDHSRGLAAGGAPAEDNSFMIDFNWALPFSIGNQDFSVEGHIEYIGGRDNELGNNVKWHILGQPQFRYDLGKLLGGAGRFYVGLDLQFWINKLGDAATDEIAPQALAVWRF